MQTINRIAALVGVVRTIAKTRADKRRFKNWHRERHIRRVR